MVTKGRVVKRGRVVTKGGDRGKGGNRNVLKHCIYYDIRRYTFIICASLVLHNNCYADMILLLIACIHVHVQTIRSMNPYLCKLI